MKHPVIRAYEVQFDQNDLRRWLAECPTPTGVGPGILTIESVTHTEAKGDGVVLRIRLTETSQS